MFNLKPSYFIDKGNYKEIIRDDKLLFKCPFCGEWFRALAYHTRQKEGVTAKELRQMMGLKHNYQLTTPDIKERHREIAFNNEEVSIVENLIKGGIETRFKKGCEGHIRKNWSSQALGKTKIKWQKYKKFSGRGVTE